MYLIDKILIDEEICKVKFSCDLPACKGSCCTFEGEIGAPVLDSEVQKIYAVYDIVKEYLSGHSIATIEKRGSIEGTKGNYSTVSINKRDCVFVYYEGDIAKCAIEKAYFDKKISFREPLSCHLFPIRVSDFGGTYIYYQKFDECKPGIVKGEKENSTLYKFLKEPIIRAYGKEWYEHLEKYLTAKENEKEVKGKL